jgi:hypothetical protein
MHQESCPDVLAKTPERAKPYSYLVQEFSWIGFEGERVTEHSCSNILYFSINVRHQFASSYIRLGYIRQYV